MAWYLKYYKHRACGTRWTDEWSCACNDKCPVCNAEIEAFKWEDLTVVVESNEDGTWVVLTSPITAEDKPAYVQTQFDSEQKARRFASKERRRLIAEMEQKYLMTLR